jgi:hypothetical protein
MLGAAGVDASLRPSAGPTTLARLSADDVLQVERLQKTNEQLKTSLETMLSAPKK